MSMWSFNTVQPLKLYQNDALPLMVQVSIALGKVVYFSADYDYKDLAERLEWSSNFCFSWEFYLDYLVKMIADLSLS